MIEKLFHSFQRRILFKGNLVADTAIHIGSGITSDIYESESGVIRDVFGRPYIPGSSFKGVFRSFLESVARSIRSTSSDSKIWSCNPLDEKERCCINGDSIEQDKGLSDLEKAERIFRESCTICRIFGSVYLAGRVSFPDFPLNTEQDIPIMLRHGVGIDRDSGTAAQHVKYDFEAIPPGTSFGFRMIFDNPSDAELGFIANGLKIFADGYMHLGGKTARGLGQIHIDITDIEITTATSILNDTKNLILNGTEMKQKIDTWKETMKKQWIQGVN